ncbi:MAG: hypothetical protein A2849_01065 [Candidatus Taylorbacteria bacterium RIFCSPHIGHO2_01_FULL_51_15]|uniref:GtrA/DPMS transmembrane domain-containing protein n=1 Tax=Candidatus Taylorbacteria bacterium RIFCSPHIGHO2_01_FULL_51_15 TaxID=1802304 RepID=A0A1G2MB23_9BACT|nr:MAG: hypothetical protein A2849_01065 [Candidatus Taylorbacteria bacterium RIFCSPHIGHO2_01_FULL_51_15]
MLRSLQQWEETFVSFAEKHVPWCAPHARKYQRLFRYLASGGTAAAVDLLALYIGTDLLHIHYLISAALAFIVAFFVSFMLQKFWTFQDHSIERVRLQMTLYFLVAGGNLALNTLLMYFFVEKLHLWYLLAQVVASGLIAFESFFISRYLFRGNKDTSGILL